MTNPTHHSIQTLAESAEPVPDGATILPAASPVRHAVEPENQRHIDRFTIDWAGITLSVSYEPVWLGTGAPRRPLQPAHLQVEAIRPERAKLPITDTGYRSHFLGPDDVADAGGPVAYVLAWLNHEAQSPAWQAHVAATRQLSLF